MFRDTSDNALRAVMSVEPDYLDSSFAAMAENYGSVDTYLNVALGVTLAMREQIVARLVK